MPKKKTPGVHAMGGGKYKIDKTVLINGKRVRVYKEGFLSVSEAVEAMPQLIEKKRREFAPETCPKKFSALVAEYENYRSVHAKGQTVLGVHYLMSKHILPTFGELMVSEAFTHDRVQRWYARKASGTADSQERKNKVFSEFRKLLDYAWKMRMVDSETHRDLSAIVENVKLSSKPKPEKETWTYEQETMFMLAVPKNTRDYPMFALFLYLGCRLGEFLGLTWDCYDRKKGTISIRQQVINAIGGPILTDELKTNESYRVDELDAETKAILDDYMDTIDSPKGFMFPSPIDDNAPLSRNCFRRKLYHYASIAGVPKITPHGARHSKATAFMGVCSNMEEVKACARFLGHSATMMADVYAHVKNVSQQEIMVRMKEKYSA